MVFATLFEYYLKLPPYAGGLTYLVSDFISFFIRDLEVVDIPKLFHFNFKYIVFPHRLTKENSFLLL